MATLKTNTLTGTSTAGSIAVTGEGNSTTTNLQQGLTKAWTNFDGDTTVSTRDSFNISSLSENSNGDYRHGLTNNFGNDDYSEQVTVSSQNGHVGEIEREAYNTTSQMSSYCFIPGGSAVDCNIVCVEGTGDLA